MSNYSVLEDNVLSSFDCEVAKVAFLWARERIENDRYAYKAEEFARQVQNINAWSSWVLPMAAKPLAHLKSEDEMLDTLHDLKNYRQVSWNVYS